MIKKEEETIDNDDGLKRFALPLTREKVTYWNNMGYTVISMGRDGRLYVYQIEKLIK